MVWRENMCTIFQVFVVLGFPHALWVLWEAATSQSQSSKPEWLPGRPTNWGRFIHVSEGSQTTSDGEGVLAPSFCTGSFKPFECLPYAKHCVTSVPHAALTRDHAEAYKLGLFSSRDLYWGGASTQLPGHTVGDMGVHPFSKSQLPMAGVPLPSLWELRQAEEQEYVLQDNLDRMLQDRMLSSATDRQGMGWRQRSAAVNSLFLAGLLRREEQSWQSLNIYMDTVQLSVAYSCLTPCSWVLRNTIFSSVVAYWLKLLQVLWITEKGELWRGWPCKSSCRLHSCCVEQHTLGNCLLGRVARYGRSFGGAERDE